MCSSDLWGYRNELDEQAELRRALISDALSLEAQLRTQIEAESAQVRLVAARLQHAGHDTATLEALPEVSAGFRRLWLSMTWLDASNRIVAHLPADAAHAEALAADDRSGLTSHLVAPVDPDPRQAASIFDAMRIDLPGERVIVRYSPVTLLRRGSPWWLTSRYRIRLVDGSDQVIGSVGDLAPPVDGRIPESYRVQVGPGLPGVFLELTPHVAPPAWWRQLPLGQLSGFLVLIGVASGLLRRQVLQVSRAELAWRTEVSWCSAMEDSSLVALRGQIGRAHV